MAETILVTGANRGIGAAIARRAVERGDRVIGTARSEAGCAAIRELGAVALAADVCEPASLEAVADSLRGAPLDLLVCNAGVYEGRGGLDDPALDVEAWRATLMTNVAGPFFTVRALRANLAAAQGRAAIIGSIMGARGRVAGDSYAYRASKAAAANLARCLAAELRPEGVAVAVYHPGWVKTEMGGRGADISEEESAAGLLMRFGALTLDRTGVFEDWMGRVVEP